MSNQDMLLAIKAFDRFKETGLFMDFGGAIYDDLNNAGAIPFTEDVKKNIWENAKLSLIAESRSVQFKSIKTDGMLTAAKSKSMDDLIEKYKNEDAGVYGAIKGRAKQLALNKLFSNLQEQGILLSDWINRNT